MRLLLVFPIKVLEVEKDIMTPLVMDLLKM